MPLLPSELTEFILSNLSEIPDFGSCRLVCHGWRSVLDNPEFWRSVWRRLARTLPRMEPWQEAKVPWMFYAGLILKDPYSRNLVKNGCCQLAMINVPPSVTVHTRWGVPQFPHWNHIGVHGYPPNWVKENPPEGVEDLPSDALKDTSDLKCCFSLGLTHSPNTLHQKIDLVSEGVAVPVLTSLKPRVSVSAWVYIHDGDASGSSVAMMVKLLDEDDKPVAGAHLLLSGRNQRIPWVEETYTEVMWERHHGWKKHEISFEHFEPRVRKVLVMFLGDNVKLTGIKLNVHLTAKNNQII